MTIRRFLFPPFLFSLLFPLMLFSQENEGVANNDSVYSFVDQTPEFPGGISGLNNYLNQSLLYPKQAINDSIEGRVYVGFIIEANGSVSNVKTLRGIGSGCDQEAIRVITEMPAWKPGKLNGKTVRVSKTLPITFKLAVAQPSQSKIYLEVNTLPSFVGGTKALDDYLTKTISAIEWVLDSTTSSIVNVYFVVETDGSITNVRVKDPIAFAFDEKAIQAVRNMPKWKPGKIGNTNVRVLLLIPINFGTYQIIDTQPEFPGGMAKLYKYLAQNVRYPAGARESGIQGRVYINFFIESDGTITNVRVIRGVQKELDEEAVRVVKNMPRWKAGIHLGKPVRVSFNMPIKFTLQ